MSYEVVSKCIELIEQLEDDDDAGYEAYRESKWGLEDGMD